MTNQTVTFKEKKYNIDDDKTAKNLTQIIEKDNNKIKNSIEMFLRLNENIIKEF